LQEVTAMDAFDISKIDIDVMRSVDVRTVDPMTLVDILDTKVDPNKPLPERMLDFIRQIRNPYCFRCGDTIVKVSYTDTTTTMEERMEGFFRAL